MSHRDVRGPLAAAAATLVGVLLGAQVAAQHVPEGTRCIPISERTGDTGCWIIADWPLGKLGRSEIFGTWTPILRGRMQTEPRDRTEPLSSP